MRNHSISIALLSAAIIAFQLVLMQILSIVQWYHFAYMVISVALLGFGAAGTFLALFRERMLRNFDTILPLTMFLCSLAMACVVYVSQLQLFRYDSYLVFVENSHVVKLIMTYLLFFLPFFFGALAIGMLFTRYIEHIGKIYFANLLGSGIGGLLILGLFFVCMPQQLPAVISLLTTIAGFLALNKIRIGTTVLGVISVIVAIAVFVLRPELRPSEFKDISKTLLLPDARIDQEQNSPHGLLQIVSSSVLRYGPGLSLTSKSAPSIERAAFVNGDWLGPQIDFSHEEFAIVLDQTTMALPFVTGLREHVLFMHAGTAPQIIQAAHHHSRAMTLVESNSTVMKLLRMELERGKLLQTLEFHFSHNDARHYISRDTSTYDLILLPMIGAFGGTNGIYATMEQFLFTVEGFDDMWDRLSEDGAISVTTWMDYPLRNPLKILATVAEALESHQLDIHQHLAVVRSWGTVTFLVSKQPLRNEETSLIRAFCDTMQFDPVLLPGIIDEERTRYNALQDSSFFIYFDQVLSPDRDAFYTQYVFNIRPATDNKPYFSQFLRWKSLDKLSLVFGNRLPFFEIGYIIVLLTLVQITVIAFLFIILPLFRLGWRGGRKANVLLYFGGLGLGYMLVEMVLIQRLTLYFGNPVYATSASISGILIFSGIGSYLSERYPMSLKKLMFVFMVIIGFIVFYSIFLMSILQQAIGLSLWLKVLLVMMLIAPLALCMGMPFPTGLSLLSRQAESHVPWAWGINSCFSVVSAACATVLAIEFGFVVVMLTAALGYVFPLISTMRHLS